jgi:hypothetical protein
MVAIENRMLFSMGLEAADSTVAQELRRSKIIAKIAAFQKARLPSALQPLKNMCV